MNKFDPILNTLFILSLINIVKAVDYGFFYDNYKEEIIFYTEQVLLSNTIYPENVLLKSSNMQINYISSALKNKFKIEYYTCPINSISTKPLTLIKVSFNITKEEEKYMVKEVIMDLSRAIEKKLVFPNNYYDEFTIVQDKEASNYGRKARNTIIYDTFGFDVISSNNLNFKIVKILLVNFRKNKVNYLANLSGDILNTYYEKNYIFDIYLKNMPEDFDIYVTLEIIDKNMTTTGKKILIVQKDFKYPNYRIEDANPNKKMFIVALTFILIAFIITGVLCLLKIICCC